MNDHTRFTLDDNGAAFDLVVDGGLDAERTQLRLGDFSLSLRVANEATATGSEC